MALQLEAFQMKSMCYTQRNSTLLVDALVGNLLTPLNPDKLSPQPSVKVSLKN